MNWFNADNTYVKSFHDVTFHQAQKLMDEHPTPIDMRSSNYGR